jgi:hypothetical protein
MSDASFFRSLVPSRFRILGLKLHSLTLGHVHLLESIDCAFLLGEMPAMEDLIAGVFICSRDWTANNFWRRYPRLQWLYQWQWLKRVAFRSRHIEGVPPPFNFTEKVLLFRAYLREHFDRPLYRITTREDGSPVTAHNDAPTAQTIKVALMGHLNFRESELLDRPWSECLMDYLTWKCMKGDIQFMDREAVEEAKDVATRIAEKLKSGELKLPKR